MTPQAPKTQGWLFSIGSWESPYNADGSRGVLWSESSSTDPSRVAEDIARDRALQSDALICLTELATGRRHEVLVKAVRAINYGAAGSREIKSTR